MKVVIISKNASIVKVHTELGDFKGVWCSPEPVLSKNYIVELDSDDIITLETIKVSGTDVPSIKCVNEIIYITGLLEEIEDNVIFLRIHDSILMLETQPNLNLAKYLGFYVEVKLNSIQLYDINI